MQSFIKSIVSFMIVILSCPRYLKTFVDGGRCDHSQNKMLCLPQTYSKFELPYVDSVNVVEIGIDISDVLRINDKEYSVTFSCYFNVLWKEPRLFIEDGFFKDLNISSIVNRSSDFDSSNAESAMIPVNLELVNDLWLPNIFIYNLKTFKVVEVLSKHAGLWISAGSEVFYSQATHITFICPMRFDSFPLDTQTCKFQVGSYSYDDTKMVFIESPKVKGYAETSRSIVLDYEVHILKLKQKDRILAYGTLGNYSLAGFEMVLNRYVSHYIITYYLPSGLFVVVSWISFVVPPDVIPGRMALLITLFLVLVNIFNSVTTNTPKAEGLTAIEAWMLACILFVFGALVEYAVILFRRQAQGECDEEMYFNAVNSNLKSYDVAPRNRRSLVRYQQNFRTPSTNNVHHQCIGSLPSITTTPSTASTTFYQQQLQHQQRVKLMCKENNKYEIDEGDSNDAKTSSTPSPLGQRKPVPPPPPPRAFERQNSALLQQQQHQQQPNNHQVATHRAQAAITLNKYESSPSSYQPKVEIIDEQDCQYPPTPKAGRWNTFCGEDYLHVDRFFLVAFPLLFLIFNVIYWLSYGSNFFFQRQNIPTDKY